MSDSGGDHSGHKCFSAVPCIVPVVAQAFGTMPSFSVGGGSAFVSVVVCGSACGPLPCRLCKAAGAVETKAVQATPRSVRCMGCARCRGQAATPRVAGRGRAREKAGRCERHLGGVFGMQG